MLNKVGEFLKKYWQLLLVAAIVVAGYAWIHNLQSGWAQTVADLNHSHQIEIEKINEAREREAKEHERQLKELQDSLAKIQADYTKALEDLEKVKSDRQKEIVKKYGNDADGLAKLLADQYGFTVKPASP